MKSFELNRDLNDLSQYFQQELEAKYREELMEHFGVEFNHLFTMTNLPVKRFADFLYRRNELEVGIGHRQWIL
jgi:hypothetical protein